MLRNVPEITDEPADGSICAIEWTKWSIDEILDDYRANHLLETSVSLEQLPFGTVDRPEATWRSSKSVCPSSAPDSQEGNND